MEYFIKHFLFKNLVFLISLEEDVAGLIYKYNSGVEVEGKYINIYQSEHFFTSHYRRPSRQ